MALQLFEVDKGLSLQGQASIIPFAGTPNTNEPKGSLALDTTNGKLYLKTGDTGSDWTEQGADATTETGYINTFIGKNSGNETPSYTSQVYVANEDSLEAAIGKLDAALDTQATDTSDEFGFVRSFVGKGAAGEETPTYTSFTYTGGEHVDLEAAIGGLDDQLVTQAGSISDANDELGFIRSFIGKDAAGTELPTFTSNNYLGTDVSLETAISNLDDKLKETKDKVVDLVTYTGLTTESNLPDFGQPEYIAAGGDLTDAAIDLDAGLILARHIAEGTNITTEFVLDEFQFTDQTNGSVVEWMLHLKQGTKFNSMHIAALYNTSSVDYTISSKLNIGGSITDATISVVKNTVDTTNYVQLKVASSGTAVDAKSLRVTL